jgi:hypothetical protein
LVTIHRFCFWESGDNQKMDSNLANPIDAFGSPPLPWSRALTLAGIAMYGPPLVMCLYTQSCVSCSHCRHAVWQLLALAPGVEVGVLGQLVFHLPRLGDAVTLMIYGGLSLTMLGGWMLLLRRSNRWRWGIFGFALLLASLGAWGLLALIRA